MHILKKRKDFPWPPCPSGPPCEKSVLEPAPYSPTNAVSLERKDGRWRGQWFQLFWVLWRRRGPESVAYWLTACLLACLPVGKSRPSNVCEWCFGPNDHCINLCSSLANISLVRQIKASHPFRVFRHSVYKTYTHGRARARAGLADRDSREWCGSAVIRSSRNKRVIQPTYSNDIWIIEVTYRVGQKSLY